MGAQEILHASAFSQGQRFAALHKGDVLAALRRATGKEAGLSVVAVREIMESGAYDAEVVN